MKTLQLMCAILLACTTLVHASGVASLTGGKDQPATPVSLSDLAVKSDLVALVQVKDTDYRYTRSFPSEGSAYLKVLIAYKRRRPGEEIIEVYEKGLHPHECYFANPTVFEEGRRFLVFLRFDPDDPEIYRGQPEGCALEVLVRSNRRYALRYPVEGIELTDKLDELASSYEFQDHYALASEAALSPQRRDDLLKSGMLVPYEDGFKYTHGVDLTAVRKLMKAGLQDHNRH